MFLSLTLGSAASALLPLPVAGSAAPVAAQAPKRLYIWAVAMARAGNPISQETLSQALKVTPDQAAHLIGRLVERGVVAAPNAAGVARAVQPLLRTTGQSSVLASTATGTGTEGPGLSERIQKMIEATDPQTSDQTDARPDPDVVASPSNDDSGPPEA